MSPVQQILRLLHTCVCTRSSQPGFVNAVDYSHSIAFVEVTAVTNDNTRDFWVCSFKKELKFLTKLLLKASDDNSMAAFCLCFESRTPGDHTYFCNQLLHLVRHNEQLIAEAENCYAYKGESVHLANCQEASTADVLPCPCLNQ